MAGHESDGPNRPAVDTSAGWDRLVVPSVNGENGVIKTPPGAPPLPSRQILAGPRSWVGALFDRWALPDDDMATDPFARVVTATPPWLVSMIVHLGLMIMMGLIVLKVHQRAEEPDSVEIDISAPTDDNEIYAETLGEQLDDPSVTMSSNGPADESSAVAMSDLPPVDDPLAGLPMIDLPKGGTLPSGTSGDEVPAIGLALTGREPGMKQALLKAYGGTALTEDSVKLGLEWLAKRQQRTGMWSLQGQYTDGARRENEEAATGLALLAFQGAGYTPQGDAKDPFTRVVRKGWTALSEKMDSDGRFFQEGDNINQQLYTQAICTIALCELFGMTGDYQYRDAAQKAVDYCVKIQAPEGGWRYQPGIDSDLSVTGWFSMAMQSARMSGLDVPSPVFVRINEFLDSVAREDGSQYAYRVHDGATLTLSAEGLLCRQYLGWKHDDERLTKGVDYLLANLPTWDRQNVYYWYYGTQVCHHMEGDAWQKWNAEMRQLLPEHQVKRGKERGSWDPGDDRWGADGGRLYVTCLSLFVLEVYYRHLPLYQTGAMAQ